MTRRLLCSGRVRTALHGREGSLLDLGRSHRIVSDRLLRALLIRDAGCCTYPGCESAAGLEAHHVTHWIDGGRTDQDNLVLLCRAHHHAHHDGEFGIITAGDAVFLFIRRDGRTIPASADPAAFADSTEPLGQEGIDADAATTRWGGEHLDRDWAIAVLAQRRESAGPNTAA